MARGCVIHLTPPRKASWRMCGLGSNQGQKGQFEGTEANLCHMKADMYLGENNRAVNGMDLISVGTCFEARIDRKEGAQVSMLKQPQPDKSKHRTSWELPARWRGIGNDGFQDTGHQATKVSDAREMPQCTALGKCLSHSAGKGN